MDFWRRSAVLLVAASPCLAHCTPDFDALSAGGESVSRGGDASPGGTHEAGGSSGSSATTGGQPPTSGGTTSGGAGAAPASGAAGIGSGAGGSAAGSGGSTAGTGGSAAGSTAGTGGSGGSTAGTDGNTAGTGGSAAGTGGTGGGTAGAGGSSAGTGGQPGCVTPHAGQSGYDDFDAGLAGQGFPDPQASCSMQTLHGATCGEQLDPSAGKTCPGALQLSIAFKAYASGTANDEIAFGSLDFSFADWSAAKALHVMVKVSPAGAPINGVQLYLQSGQDFFYKSMFDAVDFKTGDWHEMVFSLANTGLDLTKMRRLGTQIVLDRAGTPGIPTAPPAIDVLVDDVWLEPK